MSQNHSDSMLKADLLKRKARILKITDPKERNREISYFVVDTLYDITKQKPPVPPKKYTDFKAMSQEAQYKVAISGFWQDQEVKEYVDQRDWAIQQNKDNVAWLKGCLLLLDKDEIEKRSKVNAKIVELDQSHELKEAYNVIWTETPARKTS